MNQPYYGYGYGNDFLSPGQATKVKVDKVTISLNTHYYASFGNNGSAMRQENVSDTIKLESPKDIKKYSCWLKKVLTIHLLKWLFCLRQKWMMNFILLG
ncbi:MAG: hypothetical protein ACOX28_04835 [Bacilli bacterium]